MATARSNDIKIQAEVSEALLTQFSSSSIVFSEKFNFADHARKALQAIESFFNEQFLTDVTIVIGNKRIDVHRLVLSASSPYFATMFKSSFKESVLNEIQIKGINEDALRALVQYCYTASIELREDNVEILLATARLLQMDPVVEACSKFIIKQLHPCNCLGIRTFAESQGCDSLSSAAHAYALENFIQVVGNEEFLSLSADRLAELLESEDVHVPSEETIFNALIKWLQHDSMNRVKDASKLMRYVKLSLLTSEFIAGHIEGNELFNDQKAIQDVILEAYRYHLLRNPTDSVLKSAYTRPRKSTADVLLALGEKDDDDAEDLPRSLPIDAFHIRKNTWKNITRINYRGRSFGAVCFEDKLFLVGGSIDETSTNTVEYFDFSNESWETWPSMQTCRESVGVGILKGFLYAVGGFNESLTDIITVERCNLASKEWSFVAPMSTERLEPGVAVLNNKLYVVGGQIGECHSKTMEYYDPETNEWVVCSPMSETRDGAGIGVLYGYIYAIGGTGDTFETLNSVERYDPKTDEWTMIAPMNVERCVSAVCVLDNRLFVVGGFGGDRSRTSVEVYDPDLNEWQELAPLDKDRAAPCAVLDRAFCKL